MNQDSYLSNKPIDVNERLIFALDFESNDQAKKIVETLGDAVNFYKLGLELFMAGSYYEMVDWLVQQDKKYSLI